MATLEPGYQRVHVRLQKERGNAKELPCSGCGLPAYEWALQDPDPARSYSEDLTEYEAMCRSCHQALDRARRWGKEEYRQARTEANHQMWEDPEYREKMRASAAEVSSRRRRCSGCDLVSSPGGVGRHQQVSGHTGHTDEEK